MKLSKIAMQEIILGLALALLLGIASARAAEDASPVGKVRGIYVEAGRGILIEQSVARKPGGAVRWADVDLGAGASPERRRVLVKLPAELGTELGDLVQVSLAQPQASLGGAARIPMPEVSRATRVAAKWFTPQAEAFDGAGPLASLRGPGAASAR